MSKEKVIETARAELSVTEYPPGSNLTKYGVEYGLNGVPWCVIFLWWVFKMAGEAMAFFGGAQTASCGVLLRWFRDNGWTVRPQDVRPGDILILNFSGTQDTEHCGLVADVLADGSCMTVEGNTSPGMEGSQDNGGSVAMKRRYPRNFVGVCRPQYKGDSMDKLDYIGHWAEAAIRRVKAEGLMQGYTDGSFQPDKPVTRAELAQVLKNLLEVLDK